MELQKSDFWVKIALEVAAPAEPHLALHILMGLAEALVRKCFQIYEIPNPRRVRKSRSFRRAVRRLDSDEKSGMGCFYSLLYETKYNGRNIAEFRDDLYHFDPDLDLVDGEPEFIVETIPKIKKAFDMIWEVHYPGTVQRLQ
jgi:hypothetical protein